MTTITNWLATRQFIEPRRPNGSQHDMDQFEAACRHYWGGYWASDWETEDDPGYIAANARYHATEQRISQRQVRQIHRRVRGVDWGLILHCAVGAAGLIAVYLLAR